ncbi:MAG: leucyl aminopeptidase [Sandaracinaceae bacterium]|nr:leucyl aminopeptidase [Sandaracinaceae bacterium]
MRISLSDDSLQQAPVDILVIGVRSTNPKKDALLDKVVKAAGGTVVTRAIKDEGFEAKSGQTLKLAVGGRLKAPWLLLVGLDAKATPEDARTLGARAVRAAKQQKSVGIVLPEDAAAEVRLAVEGLIGASYRYETYKTGSRRSKGGVKSALLLTADKKRADLRDALKHGRALADAVNLARDLVNGPPNDIHPIALADAAKKACDDAAEDVEKGSLTCKIYDEKWLTKERMALFLAVNKGAATPARLAHMVYKPAGAKKRVVFVGKGLTFDAGGLCIKPAGSMVDMKCDMAGAAVTIAIVVAAARMRIPVEVHGVIGTTENMLGAAAYRPSDVYTSREGKTVEIINTDAEGRLVLADVLHWASELEPDYLVDHATLTGACMVALGNYRAALYGNDDEFADAYMEAASDSGEAYWRMPLDADLKSSLKSDVADLKHTGSRYGGSITAALFLQEFIGKTRWVHLDIAGPAYVDHAHGRYPKGGTGFGVATGVSFLHRLAKEQADT